MDIVSRVYAMGGNPGAQGGFTAFIPLIITFILVGLIYYFMIKPIQEKNSLGKIQQTKIYGTYDTTRFISQIVSFIGWVTVLISLFTLLIIILKNVDSENRFQLIGLLPVAGGVVSGLFLVLSGQLTRAIVDNTDYTKEMLTLLKSRE